MSWRALLMHRSQSSAMTDSGPRPRYSVSPGLALAITASVLLGKKRSFSADAKRMIKTFTPAPRVENAHCIPRAGPFILVTNHYYKPGYRVWWGIAAIAAAIAECRPSSREMVWLMTNRWTYTNHLQSLVVTPLTKVVFTRLARMYGFVPTPPMPRQPQYTEEGAQSVRRILSLLDPHKNVEMPAIGIAPEGRDSPDGSLIEPPFGTGRFLIHMAKHGLHLLPVGVAEIEGALTIRCGPLFTLDEWPHLSKSEQDRQASTQVMLAIGRLLPAELWGVYREEIQRIAGSEEA